MTHAADFRALSELLTGEATLDGKNGTCLGSCSTVMRGHLADGATRGRMQ